MFFFTLRKVIKKATHKEKRIYTFYVVFEISKQPITKVSRQKNKKQSIYDTKLPDEK